MAHANSTTQRFLCNECAIGVMTPDTTPAGEPIYQCRYCNHCGQAAIVEADNTPMPTGYGARILALINECGCDAVVAAQAIVETHRTREAA
ncbi:MAG: hypothetical protein MI924_12780 [Chloroflexales bacterium]|nr:hypothetical protein [Chloroflexales bacterium]